MPEKAIKQLRGRFSLPTCRRVVDYGGQALAGAVSSAENIRRHYFLIASRRRMVFHRISGTTVPNPTARPTPTLPSTGPLSPVRQPPVRGQKPTFAK